MINPHIKTVAIINLDQKFHNECYMCSSPIRVNISPARSCGTVSTFPDYPNDDRTQDEQWLFVALDNLSGLPTAYLLCGKCGAKHHQYGARHGY